MGEREGRIALSDFIKLLYNEQGSRYVERGLNLYPIKSFPLFLVDNWKVNS